MRTKSAVLALSIIVLSLFTGKAIAEVRVYLASPLGFSEATRLFKDTRLKPELEKLGFQVVDPWVLTPPDEVNRIQKLPYGLEQKNEWQKLNKQIGARNKSEIDRADIVVAILDGPDVDSGTASEIGYAFAMKKRVFGYRNDFRSDSDDEGAVVNLQVEYFIRASGGTIAFDLDSLVKYFKGISAAVISLLLGN